MPTQTYHAGFEGAVQVNAVDYNVTDFSGTDTTTEISTTNTSNYDATDQRCYTDVIGGTSTFEGSFTAGFDSNNKPWPSLRSGSVVTNLVLNCALTGSLITLPVAYIKSVDFKQGGMDGKIEFTCNFRSKRRYTFT